jgi:hypothetical protein
MSRFIPFVSDEDVSAIGRGLFDRTLPKVEWTHAAHFAAAIWVIRCRSDLEAETALPPAIRAYNESTGVANTDSGGYHETITQASLRVARAFVAKDVSSSLFETCNAVMTSRFGTSDWIFEYWSRPRILSPVARKMWVDPDLRVFPY